MPPEPILHLKWLALIERVRVYAQTVRKIVGVDTLRPPVPQFGFQRPASKLKPSVVEIRALFIKTGRPDHHRCCVCHGSKLTFGFLVLGNLEVRFPDPGLGLREVGYDSLIRHENEADWKE